MHGMQGRIDDLTKFRSPRRSVEVVARSRCPTGRAAVDDGGAKRRRGVVDHVRDPGKSLDRQHDPDLSETIGKAERNCLIAW